ncbi:MAG: putative molybdopterin biosynthesis protein [Gammaproteobacteria bacterium]|jgi:putative molybdopterin biosynthesis protein
MQEFLTTREVAALLRVKERKIYELVSERAIPVSRMTGKLLFPRDLVDAWIRGSVDFAAGVDSLKAPPQVIAGSHDPLLEWAIRQSGCGLASYFDGSLDGLERVADGRALGAGMHVFEARNEQFNRAHVMARMPGAPIVLIEFSRRSQGLVVAEGNPHGIATIGDLRGRRFIPRQKDAGSYVLFEHLLETATVARGDLDLIEPPARSEADVALAVSNGKADAGLAIESAARQYRLDFVPLFNERYDLLIGRREYFEAPVQALMGFLNSSTFVQRADEMTGYDTSGTGRVHFNGA